MDNFNEGTEASTLGYRGIFQVSKTFHRRLSDTNVETGHRSRQARYQAFVLRGSVRVAPRWLMDTPAST